MVAVVKPWFEGVECEWLRRGSERTWLVAGGDIYGSVAWMRLERVEGFTSLDASPIVTFLHPRDATVETVFGRWPPPVDVLMALAHREVSGRALQRLTHLAYWQTLCHSRELRAWVAATYPDYWKSVTTALPEMETR